MATAAKKQANKDNGDMYVPVYDNGVYARIDVPLQTTNLHTNSGATH